MWAANNPTCPADLRKGHLASDAFFRLYNKKGKPTDAKLILDNLKHVARNQQCRYQKLAEQMIPKNQGF
jgi:hypothetical protein